jgi:hypothetical protein
MKTSLKIPTRRSLSIGLLIIGLLVGWVGCTTTPERRIQQNPELFQGLSPAEQEAVRTGQVELGYTPEMVFLALGEPDRKITRKTPDDMREIWIYQGRFLTTDTVRVYDQYGSFRPVRSPMYLDRTVEHVYVRARLEFVEGELVSVEQVER